MKPNGARIRRVALSRPGIVRRNCREQRTVLGPTPVSAAAVVISRSGAKPANHADIRNASKGSAARLSICHRYGRRGRRPYLQMSHQYWTKHKPQAMGSASFRRTPDTGLRTYHAWKASPRLCGRALRARLKDETYNSRPGCCTFRLLIPGAWFLMPSCSPFTFAR